MKRPTMVLEVTGRIGGHRLEVGPPRRRPMRRIRNTARLVVGFGFAMIAAVVLAMAALVGGVGLIFLMGFHWVNEMED